MKGTGGFVDQSKFGKFVLCGKNNPSPMGIESHDQMHVAELSPLYRNKKIARAVTQDSNWARNVPVSQISHFPMSP